MEELPFDHEPCINHMAVLMANEDVAIGHHTNWDAAYESAWNEIVLNIKWEASDDQASHVQAIS